MIRYLKMMPPFKTFLAILFLLLQTVCTLYLPYLMAGIVDKGIIGGNVSYIYQQGGIMIGFALLGLIGALLNMYIAGDIAFGLGAKLREKIYSKVLSFSKKEFDDFGTATLITRNTVDVTQVQTFVDMVLKFLILAPLYLVGGIFLTWKLNATLAIPFMVVIPFMGLAAFVIYRFASPLYKKIQLMLDKLNLHFREGIIGIRVIRAFSKDQEEYEKYTDANGEFTKTSITAGTIMSVFVPLITLVINIATIMIIWIGGQAISSNSMEVGAIMAAISYSAQILMGFALLTNVILALPKGQVSAKRITEVLDYNVSITNSPAPKKVKDVSLIFENVSFRYEGASRNAIDDLNFSINRGQTLAIIGGTGDGKTTILNLISRLYDVGEGAIRIGGTDIRDMKQEELKEIVSYSPQKSSLLYGTIRSNMLVAKPDATDEEIYEALEAAQAIEFIEKMDNGLDSIVEKDGLNFSGGQKQRLCIARTLLKDAEIYLFDDSFSALDFKTDAKVRKFIKEKLANKIVIMVAQRINTIIDANEILVLDKGHESGYGSHNLLSKTCLIYQEIMQSQGYGKEVLA